MSSTIELTSSINRTHRKVPVRSGLEDSAYEGDGDARRKFWIKPLKETDLRVAQAFFDP